MVIPERQQRYNKGDKRVVYIARQHGMVVKDVDQDININEKGIKERRSREYQRIQNGAQNRRVVRQEYPESADPVDQGNSLPLYCPHARFGQSAEWSDHPKNVINCSLYHCRATLEISSKFAHNLLSNCQISDLAVSNPDCYQNVISCSFYHPRPIHKISLQSIYNFLNYIANGETDRQTDRQINIQTQQTISLLFLIVYVLFILKVLTLWKGHWEDQSLDEQFKKKARRSVEGK